MTSFAKMQTALVLLLSFVTLMTLDDVKSVWIFSLLFIFALLLRKWVWHKVFLRGPAINLKSQDITDFIFLGSRVPHDPEHEEEQNRLRYWVETYAGWRYLLSAFGLAAISFGLVGKISLLGVAFLGITLLLLSIIYYEHFLLPIFAATFIFLFNFKVFSHPRVAAFVFAFLLFINLIFYSWSRPQNPSKNFKFLGNAFKLALLMGGLVFLFDKIIPQTRLFKASGNPLSKKIAKHVAQRIPMRMDPLQRTSLSQPELGQGNSSGGRTRLQKLAKEIPAGERQELAQQAGLSQEEIDTLEKQIHESSADDKMTEKEREEFVKAAKEFSQSLDKNPGKIRDAGTEMSPREISESLEQNGFTREEIEKIKDQLQRPEDHQELVKLAKEMPKQKVDGKKLERAAQLQEGLGKERAQSVMSEGGVTQSQIENFERQVQEAKREEFKARAEKIKEKRVNLEKKLELQIKMFAKFFIFLMIFMGGLALYEFLRRVKTKKSLNEVEDEKKTQVDKERLVQEYREILKQGLTAEEEVIKTYNVFLELMDGKKQGKPCHWPTTEYTQKLIKTYPEMRADLLVLNEVFCDTLFAKKDPSAHIKVFRSSFQKVANCQIGANQIRD